MIPSDVVTRVQEMAKICEARHWKVGFAESCTGGLLASWVSSQPGVSSFFSGAVVSYARNVKAEVLGVPSHLLAAHGEVSLPVARAMAHGARQKLQVDWSVAITGIAGPTGGSADKPVGFVCFAVSGPGFEKAEHRLFDSQPRQDVQRQAAFFAFDLLLSAMR